MKDILRPPLSRHSGQTSFSVVTFVTNFTPFARDQSPVRSDAIYVGQSSLLTAWRMTNDIQLNWLLTQGLVPLFGAAVLYLIWGLFKKLAAPRSRYAWREAVDPMGWLYGAIVIAVQSAARFFEAGSSYRAWGFWCVVCAILSGILLLAAMSERGVNRQWQASAGFKMVTILFVGATLSFGYAAQTVPKRSMPSPVEVK